MYLTKIKKFIKNSWYYLQGNIRYYLYYSDFKKLISNHVLEQIHARIASMNRECFITGSCVNCGCKTTHLQMCNKNCEDCYPKMLNKIDWDLLKLYGYYVDELNTLWKYDIKTNLIKKDLKAPQINLMYLPPITKFNIFKK